MAPYVHGSATGTSASTSGSAALAGRPRARCRARTGDAARLPFADGGADVVVAGEMLEHVTDLPAVVAELCRVLAPGGTLVVDALADTAVCRFVTVTVAERIPGGPPAGLHDPALYVEPRRAARAVRRPWCAAAAARPAPVGRWPGSAGCSNGARPGGW